MSSFRQTLSIADTQRQFATKVNSALAKKMNDYFPTVLNKIHNDIIVQLPGLMKSNPIYSTIDGELGAHLGFYEGTGSQLLTDIFDEFVNGLEVTYTPIRFFRLFRGGINVSVFKYDFERLLSLDSAYIVDTERGYSLPWLQWLLMEGDRIIISGHSIIFTSKRSPASRSGPAIMGKRGKGRWRVPPQWSGTPTNNFITRHINSQLEVINRLVTNVLSRYMPK